MPDAEVEGYDHWSIPQDAGVHAPMGGILHHDSKAHISFAEVLTSSGQLQKITKLRIHLAITSDRVVTATSNLDHRIPPFKVIINIVRLGVIWSYNVGKQLQAH